MFEREIANLKRNLSAKVDLAQRFIYLKDILEIQNLNIAYKAYFNAEIDWLIYREQLLRAEHYNFDYSAPEFEDFFEALDPLLKKYARYERKDFLGAISSAIKTRLNFLIRPRTALKWFIFRGEPTRSLLEVKLRMNYFIDYPYLCDGFTNWLNERNITDDSSLISVLEFDKAIENIDNDAVFDLNPEQFAELLAPLFELFAEASEEGELTIPVEALILFFDDKKVMPVVAELEKVFDNNEKFFFDKLELVDFIYKLINQFEIPAEEAKIEPENPIESDNFNFNFDLNKFGSMSDSPEELPLADGEDGDFSLNIDSDKLFGLAPANEENAMEEIAEEIVLESNDLPTENIAEESIPENNEIPTDERIDEIVAESEEVQADDLVEESSIEEEPIGEEDEIESDFNNIEPVDDESIESNDEESNVEASEEFAENDSADDLESATPDISSESAVIGDTDMNDSPIEVELDETSVNEGDYFGADIDNVFEESINTDNLAEVLSALKQENEEYQDILAEEPMQKENAPNISDMSDSATQAEEMKASLRTLLSALKEIMETERA